MKSLWALLMMNFNKTKIFFILMTLFYFIMKFNMNENYTKIMFMDKYSCLLSTLTLLISLTLMMTNTVNKKVMTLILYFLIMMIMLTFLSSSMILFYIFFELSLLPLMVMILSFGYQPERIQAFLYLIFYTLLSSFPLLMVIIVMQANFNNKWMSFWFYNDFNINIINAMFSLLIMTSMFIKLPMYFWHLWLPKAHVEAPVIGSMILASILLKISGFGMYRLNYILMKFEENSQWFIITLLISSMISSIICLYQTDLKALIAYSSISHMSMMMTGIMLFMSSSNKSSLLLMLTHGFCSNMLFYMSNFYYEQTNTRQLMISRNMMMSLMNIWIWMIFLCLNFSLPPSLSFYSEILLVINLNYFNLYYSIMVLMSSFIIASFNIFLLTKLFHMSQYNFFCNFNKTSKMYFLTKFCLYYSLSPVLLMHLFWE